MTVRSPGSSVSGLYDIGGYDILTAAPLATMPSQKHGTISVANFGLVGKMTGSAAIISSDINLKDNGRVFIDVCLKALGVLGEYQECPVTIFCPCNVL